MRPADIVERRDKRARNVDLARAQHDEQDSVKSALDLARSLMIGDVDAGEEAIGLLRDAISSAGPSTEETRPEWMAYLYGSLGHLLLDAGGHDEALEFARKLARASPLPSPSDLERLRDAGPGEAWSREIAFVAAWMGTMNQLATFSAVSPESMERFPWYARLFRPFLARRFRSRSERPSLSRGLDVRASANFGPRNSSRRVARAAGRPTKSRGRM